MNNNNNAENGALVTNPRTIHAQPQDRGTMVHGGQTNLENGTLLELCQPGGAKHFTVLRKAMYNFPQQK